MLLLFAASNNNLDDRNVESSGHHPTTYNFQNPRLQGAIEMYNEGLNLFQNGNYDDAIDTFMTGIFSGRSTVQKLVEEEQHEQQESNKDDSDNDVDNPQEALDWLVTSYIMCCRSRILKDGDYTKARADAWAACSYSQNMNLGALTMMLVVCENTDDKIGELQTLKTIKQTILDDTMELSLPSVAVTKEEKFTSASLASIEKLQERIQELDDELFPKK